MKNSEIINSMKDLDATLVAIDLALEVLQRPLAAYDCSDAELDASITQFKMLKVAYLILKRNATNTAKATSFRDSFADCEKSFFNLHS